MTYSAVATSTTPVLIIYLLDISGSMSQMLGDKRRVEIVSDALQEIATEMVARSTKGEIVAPRYRLAIYAYESQVHDILGGIKPLINSSVTAFPNLPRVAAQTPPQLSLLLSSFFSKNSLICLPTLPLSFAT